MLRPGTFALTLLLSFLTALGPLSMFASDSGRLAAKMGDGVPGISPGLVCFWAIPLANPE